MTNKELQSLLGRYPDGLMVMVERYPHGLCHAGGLTDDIYLKTAELQLLEPPQTKYDPQRLGPVKTVLILSWDE